MNKENSWSHFSEIIKGDYNHVLRDNYALTADFNNHTIKKELKGSTFIIGLKDDEHKYTYFKGKVNSPQYCEDFKVIRITLIESLFCSSKSNFLITNEHGKKFVSRNIDGGKLKSSIGEELLQKFVNLSNDVFVSVKRDTVSKISTDEAIDQDNKYCLLITIPRKIYKIEELRILYSVGLALIKFLRFKN